MKPFNLTVPKILNFIRISCLGAVCLTQAWMMWKFITFQLKKWREHIKKQIPKKKVTNTKNKLTTKELNRGQWHNILSSF